MTVAGPAAVIVLAAGEGTRMRSSLPKVLHGICGRSLLGHVLAATAALEPQRTLVVVGSGRDAVAAELDRLDPAATPVFQEQRNGTGHAVRTALDSAGTLHGTVVVLPGDAPLLTPATLLALVEQHAATGAAATLLTADLPDPSGYGRILRSDGGAVVGIVEQRDATPDQLAIHEVGTSVYAFEATQLTAALGRLSTDNAQGEEYLTDVVGLLASSGQTVGAVVAQDWRETVGVNDRLQLADVRRSMRDRLLRHWMLAGATITDPQTTWLGVDVVLEPDVTVHQNTQLHGRTLLERGCVVGPNTTLTNTRVGPGASVVASTCVGADVGEQATVGPYTYLRPGTRLGRGAKAGSYVEIKAAEIGDGAKVPHLSYVGDATVGAGSNIGAATVFVNYDGRDKHRTTVGEDVRIGSDTMLVAPVSIGDGAYTAAGSVITQDVPAGALGVGRAKQRNIEGWVARRRARSAGQTDPTPTDSTRTDQGVPQ
ncbi:MAG: bifunctional UDP-N-acetylglucosamine diphosphorylase/glucosamine-1-phosphate N-acetyltransferase GlmU [Actinomycetota bacterium]|nr:bifunctional UDP-N-acetylglucosamine diphosphorylase/glucosamine-1-phosphate N-acetyltransferase GlmU [Actinomycetota bacterium]